MIRNRNIVPGSAVGIDRVYRRLTGQTTSAAVGFTFHDIEKVVVEEFCFEVDTINSGSIDAQVRIRSRATPAEAPPPGGAWGVAAGWTNEFDTGVGILTATGRILRRNTNTGLFTFTPDDHGFTVTQTGKRAVVCNVMAMLNGSTPNIDGFLYAIFRPHYVADR